MDHEDIEQVRLLIREELTPLKSELAAVQSGMAGMQSAMAGMQTAMAALKSDITEQMRDMQTELLRGLEAFARGNFSRMHIFDTRISSK
jgi:uncharacterized protein involved in exopolysaccharide biosynthesis